jgi:hypothetical protein
MMRVAGGEVRGAVGLMREFEARYMNGLDTIEPKAWNALCWYGTLFGEAELVSEFGDKAVRMAKRPRYSAALANYRDTRGVNRAVRGKCAEGIADFEAFIKWAEASADIVKRESQIVKRQQWIKQLNKGQNPFTQAVLKSLRNE